MRGSLRSVKGVELKENDRVVVKDELWFNHSFVDFSYSRGVVKLQEDGFYLDDRKLEIYDHIEIISNERKED